MLKRIKYNAPVILTFSLISLLSLFLGYVTNGWTTDHLFCVYRSSFLSPMTYLRMFTHVLGHANLEHYVGNMTLLLVIGPAMEEKYGSRALLFGILLTAFVSAAVQMVFFPHTALLGASGIVFMLIILSSLGSFEKGTIPLTLILVAVFYIGGEVVDGLVKKDSVSQLTHIVGGVCGGAFGFWMKEK